MDYKNEYAKWLESSAVSDEERKELLSVKDDDEAIKSRFFKPLEFGTGGLRGIMGAGINRMNVHVVRQATQGFAGLIVKEGQDAMKRGVVICHDCRHNSRSFAVEAARVMAANGVHVRIFEDLRPTPELSYAVRKYGAVAGINVTASHNPREYNGYKVYWDDGAQLPPEHAEKVIEIITETDIFTGVKLIDFGEAQKLGMIETIGAETDEAFLKKALEQSADPKAIRSVADNFKIVYTPFHGTGYKIVPEALKRSGVKQLFCVPEQMIPDGSFPTVKSPNPEEPDGFELSLKYAKEQNADLIIGTDPDADRLAVMAKSGGEYRLISGNQLGVLLLNYLVSVKRSNGTLPQNAAALKTIVSTPMAAAIAESEGIYMTETFTGFKFLAEKIKEFETSGAYQVIFSFEESIGYLIGDFVRDKDAVTAAVLAAEMTAHYISRGLTLFDVLNNLYQKYGYYAEKTINLVMPGLDGLENMKKLMARLREKPPHEIGGERVNRIRDYSSGNVTETTSGKSEPLDMSGSNVLYFELADGSIFIVRPSGTEPKIKIYIMVKGGSAADCDSKITRCIETAESFK